MRPSTGRGMVVAAVILAGWAAIPSLRAQEPWRWPEHPKNLKVLGPDKTGEKLRPIMTGFTRALGVRCTYCHVGEEGKPLSTYDFASDANPNKERAREMLRMLGDINEHLKKIQPSGDKRVNMWCHTCHAGRPRPMTLEEEMGEAFRKSGTAAAIARYKELKERYRDRGAYDFREGPLNTFAYDLLAKKEVESALQVFRLNAEEFPSSGNAWDSLAEGYLAAGKKEQAAIYYRKSLELDPDNDNALAKLREIEATP